MTGKEIRLSKLFSSSGRAVIVAIDHGQTFGPIEGLVDFATAAERLKEADGVLLAPQMVRFSGNLFLGQNSPSVLVRGNWNTIHCEPWHYQQAHIVKSIPLQSAVAAGADAVVASLVLRTGNERWDARNVSIFGQLADQLRGLGIPLIGEVFPVGGLRQQPAEFHDYVKRMCRIVCELGADAIKTFYTGERFEEVTSGTPIPVFALGAEKMEREIDALELAEKAVCAGAQGVVYGRNVVQAKDPAAFLRGLKAVVAGAATPAEAADQYSLR